MKQLLSLLAAVLMPGITSAQPSASVDIFSVPIKDIDGKTTTLKAYQGKVLLVVNVASKCGFTPQYAGLEALYAKFKAKGFVVLGFPCNQFGSQEPGSKEEIKQFCTLNYGVTFPMFDKIEVNGPQRSPIYEALAGKGSPVPGDIRWNFTKFLIGRDGKIINRCESKVKPDDAGLEKAIVAALDAK
jgi:glutathione peroxidase